MDLYLLSIIIVSLIFSAIFSGIEIAFISADKLHIELQKKQGLFSAKLLSKFFEKPSSFIGATLVGNNIALVVYGYFMALALEPFIVEILPEFLGNDIIFLILQTLISTILVLIAAEFTPKSIFLIDPNTMLTVFALPMTVIYYIMYPLVYIIVVLSKFFIVNILRLDYSEDKPVFGLTDLNNFIKNTLHIENPEEKEEINKARINTRIFNNALEFKTVKIRECMIPRTEVVAVDVEDDISDLKEAFVKSGHSKILIYEDSIDEVIGYCHSLELFKKPKDIRQIQTPIIIVPETMPASELMIQFITEHKSLALVVDEFGGTAGIVSMEDIIEEIFGEIQDEHDFEEWVEQKIDKNTYLLSARLEIDYIKDKFKWEVPEGDYDTLGGLILSVTEDIPDTGDVIDIPPFKITIVSKHENKIENIKLSYVPDKEEN